MFSAPNKFLVSPFLSLYFASLDVQLLFSLCEERGHRGGQPMRLTLPLHWDSLELEALLSAELQACASAPACFRLLIRFLTVL